MRGEDWIDFLREPADPRKKTKVWVVVPRRDKGDSEATTYDEIGRVRWYAPWRRYCYFPNEGSVYEQDCLRRIATFCETETRDHKGSRR